MDTGNSANVAFAGGYSRAQRLFEGFCIFLVAAVETVNFTRLLSLLPGRVWLTAPLAIVVGFLGADFISGMVHWLFDTWGSVDTPLVGRSVIRTFREHHFDQTAITRHDFIEANGSTAAISLLPLGIALALPVGEAAWAWGSSLALSVLAVFVTFTSQIHKWSHTEAGERPRIVRLLQRAGVLLSPEHHSEHHSAPYLKAYCITAGWLNPVLDRTGFFPWAERWISRFTGAVPRFDPLSEQLAEEVLGRSEPSNEESLQR